MHYIRDIVLERLVLEAVSDLSDFVRCYEPVFLYLLAKKNNAMRQKEYQQLQQAVENGTKRIAEIDRLIEKVFEQNAGGVLSDVILFSISYSPENADCRNSLIATLFSIWAYWPRYPIFVFGCHTILPESGINCSVQIFMNVLFPAPF